MKSSFIYVRSIFILLYFGCLFDMRSTVCFAPLETYKVLDVSRGDRTGHVGGNCSTEYNFGCGFIYSNFLSH
jgi:hypothetical protein